MASNDGDRRVGQSFSGERETHDLAELHERCNEVKKKINEKDKYIIDTSNESVEIVLNWYQRIINDLMESQSQIIEGIHTERDRARDELTQFDLALNVIHQDIVQADALSKSKSIQTRLDEWQTQLTSYQLSKDVYLPESRVFQPRYKIVYEYKTSPQAEEDWDVNTNEVITIPLPSHLSLSSTRSTSAVTTAEPSSFFPDASLPFVTPTDDEDSDRLDWHGKIEETNSDDSEYLLDPSLYHLAAPRRFDFDIHLLASNGTDLLCYSRSSKQIIFSGDTTARPIVLPWYHGNIIQLVCFDALKSFVAITDEADSNLYTIDVTQQSRLKIRLRTCLPKRQSQIVRDRIFLRTDECHLFIYYERENGQKRLRLLSPTLEGTRSYSMDNCLERATTQTNQRDTGTVLGLAVNQKHIVLFGRSVVNDDAAGQATATQLIDGTYLLVFSKSKMFFVDRIDLAFQFFQASLVLHFASVSSFSLVDQTQDVLRFFNRGHETGQIQLQASKISLISLRNTTSSSTEGQHYSSIVLMNDGSLLLPNSTKDVTQLVLGDQANEVSNWWF